jgi:hypothetical protein
MSRRLTLDGRTQSLAAWAREYGINEATLTSRLERGWSLGDALRTPIKSQVAKVYIQQQMKSYALQVCIHRRSFSISGIPDLLTAQQAQEELQAFISSHPHPELITKITYTKK